MKRCHACEKQVDGLFQVCERGDGGAFIRRARPCVDLGLCKPCANCALSEWKFRERQIAEERLLTKNTHERSAAS